MASQSSMRTPLGKVRGLGSAKGGTRAFWLERITGVALLPLMIAFVVIVLSLQDATYVEATRRLGSPLVAIVMIAAVATTAWHMKLGMTVIIEDYVHGQTLLIVSLMANSFFSALVGLAGVFAILKIAFGA